MSKRKLELPDPFVVFAAFVILMCAGVLVWALFFVIPNGVGQNRTEFIRACTEANGRLVGERGEGMICLVGNGVFEYRGI